MRATASPLEPGLAQSSSRAAIEEREISSSESWNSSSVMPSLAGDLLVGRRARQTRLEVGDRPLDVARAGAHGARHPVHRTQLVDDRALDPRDRVRLELDVAGRIEPLDRADQAEEPVRNEVAFVHVSGQPATEPPGDVLDERRVREDQPVAQRSVARALELLPENTGIGRLVGHRSERIRGLAERPVGKLAHPHRERTALRPRSPRLRRPRCPQRSRSRRSRPPERGRGRQGVSVAPRYHALRLGP